MDDGHNKCRGLKIIMNQRILRAVTIVILVIINGESGGGHGGGLTALSLSQSVQK